jgi:hypothetical protein
MKCKISGKAFENLVVNMVVERQTLTIYDSMLLYLGMG